ncbi:MAG: carboxypeptidase regulatory-like domain-containing protein, partial [Candidatus Hydrogenedentes bacterium]|nr:carboxypeptidase regulatory-like domain-containing protein [Candidatus Hydrogenedentota bacterium]
MSPRRKKSSVSTLQILLAVVFVLGILIALAFFIAPDRPEAPPASTIAYEQRPRVERPRVIERFETWRPAAPVGAEESQTAATPPAGEAAAYHISGTVLDSRTGQPIAEARITAARESSSEELASLRQAQANAIQAGDDSALDAVRLKSEEYRHRAGASSGDDGQFSIPIAIPGDYTLEVTARGYIEDTSQSVILDVQNPEAAVEILLSTGASISGTVREAGTSKGAEGVMVSVEESGQPPATTDADGRYTISGLAPGEYGVQVDLRDTAYRAGKDAPFQKITLTSADQDLQNVDFTVEAAGVVWGYVTTADRKPLPRTQVILCTSASVASQAIQAAMEQAPPIMDASEEDGYYELLGVPLNQEWRLFATSDQHAPQLAKPFILTPTKRDVRVDIFLFAGTTVYGRVVEPTGTAIPGANVYCLPGFSNLFSPLDAPQAFRETVSDDKGNFVIEELPAGDYQLFGRKGGYKIAATGEPIYPDGQNNLSSVEVVLYPVDEA